jgi:hypothetical protein
MINDIYYALSESKSDIVGNLNILNHAKPCNTSSKLAVLKALLLILTLALFACQTSRYNTPIEYTSNKPIYLNPPDYQLTDTSLTITPDALRTLEKY